MSNQVQQQQPQWGYQQPGYAGNQQQQQQSVVIVNQPSPAGSPTRMIQNQREWTTGMCGCFEDCCSCAFAYFCYPCFMCTLATELDECVCGPFCFGSLFTTPMRTKIRTMYGIKGSILQDVCCLAWCNFCMVTQMHRELKNHNMTSI